MTLRIECGARVIAGRRTPHGNHGPSVHHARAFSYKDEDITDHVIGTGVYPVSLNAGKFKMTVKRTSLSGPTACIYANIEIAHSFHDGSPEFNSETACS